MSSIEIITQDMKEIVGCDLPWEKFKDKTIFISGISGFLPAYLVEVFMYLNSEMDMNIKVIGICRNIKKAGERFRRYLQNENLKIFYNDVCDDIDLFRYKKIDYIIHAASIATPIIFKINPVGTILPNVIGTYNLLKMAFFHKAEFLLFSTSGVYGHNYEFKYPLKENDFGWLDCTLPSSCYLESKRMAENMCIAFMNQYGVRIKIVRPGINYGYGMKIGDGRTSTVFLETILKGQDFILYDQGKLERSYCYVSDLISGVFTILLKGENGEAYNIAADKEIMIRDLVKLLIKLFLKNKSKIIYKKTDPGLRTTFYQTWMNCSKIKALGWQQKISLEEGWRRTIKAYGK